MEDVITEIMDYKKPKTFSKDNPLEIYVLSSREDIIPDQKKENIKNNTDFTSDEYNSNFINELFKTRGFIANEFWSTTINVNSKIIKTDNDFVICECLIDKENKIFEKRSFPRYLFNHIENVKTNPYVILSIKSKIGSTRIDVLNGSNLVDKNAFDLNDEWNKLEGYDFNQPLDKPISL
jgi:hypothetical protein